MLEPIGANLLRRSTIAEQLLEVGAPPVVLGFGRYSADGLVTGMPDETEYPVPTATPRGVPAVTPGEARV